LINSAFGICPTAKPFFGALPRHRQQSRKRRRGDHSENRIKDLKIGFGMDYMPCGTFSANAVFFSIGVLTYNLYLVFRSAALGSGWERSQVQTVRWRLFQTAGKIVRHGRRLYLKISTAMLDTFSAIRERYATVMQEGAVPETS
jgi:hypothetical protein